MQGEARAVFGPELSTYRGIRTGCDEDMQVGAYVASAGDLNGDGYGDVIVAGNGFVRIHFGSVFGPRDVYPPTELESDENFDPVMYQRRSVVASAGDVNGDGFDDLIVGEPHHNNGIGVPSGAAAVYSGSAQGLSNTATWRITSNELPYFGWSVSSAGDVNGDGYDDVIITTNPTPVGGVATA